MKLKAATFNMQNGQTWDETSPDCSPIDLASTLEFLRMLDADVLFLQEVEEGHDGGTQIEPPPNFGVLREGLPGYDSHFAYPPKNGDELPFGLGLAIFSRFPLSGKKTHVLSAGQVPFEFGGRWRKLSERIVIEAKVRAGRADIRLLNTHLQAFFMVGASSEEHRAQRDEVERILRSDGQPTLLGGDFNSAPDEDLAPQFQRAGFLSAQTEKPTWKRMPYIVDHIFFNSAWKLLRCEVLETGCSDHHAVLAELEMAE